MLRRIARIADRAPPLGRLLRRWRDARDRRALRWARMPGHGFWIRGGNWLAAGADTQEREEVAIVAALLNHADLLIDVGANSGIFTCLAATRGQRVFAVEALPANVALLLAAVERNGVGALVEVFPVAVADGVGVLPLYGAGQGASLVAGWAKGVAFDRVLAPVNTLDNLFAARVQGRSVVMKLDVEGAEWAALAGAPALLACCTGLLVEISLDRNHPGGVNEYFADTFALLAAAGFRAAVADAARTPVTPALIAAWVVAGRTGLATENFVFTRAEPLRDSPESL